MSTSSNKVALVTGASAGLGKEYAALLAADGFDVVLVARRAERLQALAKELTAAHPVKVYVCAEDLNDPQAPQRIFSFCQEKGLFIEVLVNNAGLGATGAFTALPLEKQLSQLQVNVTALTALSHLFVAPMQKEGRGHVLNVSSTAGFQAGPFMAVYYATKAYVTSFTEALAHELKGTGVTATVHCPGATETEFAAKAGNDKTRLFQDRQPARAKEVALDGYRAMMKGKTLKVHGAMNQLLMQSLRISPRNTAIAIAAKLNRPA